MRPVPGLSTDVSGLLGDLLDEGPGLDAPTTVTAAEAKAASRESASKPATTTTRRHPRPHAATGWDVTLSFLIGRLDGSLLSR